MRRLALALTTIAVVCLSAPPLAHAAAAPVELEQPYPFPWEQARFYVVDPVPGTSYDVEVNRTSMLSATQSPDWRPLATGTTASSFRVSARQGTVACLRARISGDAANPWGQPRCFVRGLLYTRLTVRGPHAEYTARRWPGRYSGMVLYPGGRLALPGVPDHSYLELRYTPGTFTATIPHWGIAGQPEPAQTVALATYDVARRVTRGGRALVWADPDLPTLPVHDLAVVPPWLSLPRDLEVGDDLQDHEIYPDFYSDTHGWLTLTGTPVVTWSAADNPAFTPRVQVARGDMRGGVPPWVDRPVGPHVTQLRLRVKRGQILCVRARNERTDGAVTVWHRTCVVRPLDDAQLRVVGGRLRAPDPLSADGRSTRLAPGSRMVVGRVGPRPLVGVVDYPRAGWPRLVQETIDGRFAPWRMGSATGQESPLYPRADLWWSEFRRGGVAAIRNPAAGLPALSERISGVYVLPGWAR